MNAHIKKSPHYGVMARQCCCLHITQARLDWSINVSCMMSNWLKTRCLAHFNVPDKHINKNKEEAFKKLNFYQYNLCKHCNCPKIIKYSLENKIVLSEWWVENCKWKYRLNLGWILEISNELHQKRLHKYIIHLYIMIFRGIKRLI